MIKTSLLKGFEVELFTGTYSGENFGVASAVASDLPDFVTEPDQRNLEYITSPDKNYSALKKALLLPRKRLRQWLDSKKLTILPGSTLNFSDLKTFERSDQNNAYHSFIEKNYGTNVVTASIHINLGIENLPLLFAALRLIRCEASLYLALSASSPFLGGKVMGVHSQRWIQFPKTPSAVPIFIDHSHYVKWIEEQLRKGTMHNERHLWTSVRPNGPTRPYSLNRLEIRVCDLIGNCDLLLAITALLELRIISLLNNFEISDPMQTSLINLDELALLCDANEVQAAKTSLNSNLAHWQNGNQINCRDWIRELVKDVTPLAKELGMFDLLHPIEAVLRNGNQAMKWLDSYEKGASMESILQESIQEMELEESNFFHMKSSY